MQRTAVRSRCLRSVGYDGRQRQLEVEFLDGGVYRYDRVPAAEHRALMAAASRGAYLNRRIKPRYRCRQLPARPEHASPE